MQWRQRRAATPPSSSKNTESHCVAPTVSACDARDVDAGRIVAQQVDRSSSPGVRVSRATHGRQGRAGRSSAADGYLNAMPEGGCSSDTSC
jgi:hypothetical protein